MGEKNEDEQEHVHATDNDFTKHSLYPAARIMGFDWGPCRRCGHYWKSRTPVTDETPKPTWCARCHSVHWDVEKTVDAGAEKLAKTVGKTPKKPRKRRTAKRAKKPPKTVESSRPCTVAESNQFVRDFAAMVPAIFEQPSPAFARLNGLPIIPPPPFMRAPSAIAPTTYIEPPTDSPSPEQQLGSKQKADVE